LGNPEWAATSHRSLRTLDAAGVRGAAIGCDERRGLRRSVGDDELQGERDPSEFQAGLHA
jgi:hypothetical protein